ncbi:unnamed protein product [Rotaria socialis]|uniref:Uncharacterized protein n=1 Tax=Rotaria socialis TaxID=392032 RepID=A0A819V3Q0_9BILA|nr:unnamed protein product [Rotaria socialis]CAF3329712.1 unnamed protein product [Rotaria socialis]CAF3470437.1 unnamed protein product [Rotaria socialis]CAF4102714.1 unnamed protein product [Rotaria socialis]CAF4168429.1 unnamed protein product [Rotaria socialis]
MFWQCHIVTSSIDKLFDKPTDELKVEDFLDENDLIQECLNQNKRLLDYLIQENVMSELIHHVITLPNDNNFRYANTVSELLSGDFQCIQETILEKRNLDLLYSFLIINNETLNPILASFFSRIISTLINRKPNEIIDYLKSRETFKDDFFRHLDSTSITDILFRLISDCGEQRSDTIKWYEDINLIDGLMQQILITESCCVQSNIATLFSEFLRLAFDQQTGNDCDIMGPTLSSTIERLLYGMNEFSDGSSSLSNHVSSSGNDEKKSMTDVLEGKLTALVLARRILSKSNLEHLFDALIKQPILISNGYEFLHTIFDILGRHLSAPACISLLSKDDISLSNKNENEQMQINDDGNTAIVNKSNEDISALANLIKDLLIHIYITILEVIPSRLPSLIALLSIPCAPLISPSNDKTQNQFISEPLGSLRLNLIKFFSKLIYTISNDNTGDNIYEILNSNRLFHIIIDLFLKHVYNNFLHAQVYVIIRLLININSIAIKQPNDIWTRTSIDKQYQSEISKSSPYYYTNRCSYKLFQSLFKSSEINLFERLLDQYELNVASTKTLTTSSSSDDAVTSSVLHTSFVSPNSGHIAQLLRCLRDHASIFNNYASFFKSDDQQQIDDDTSVIEIRWQAALDYLTDEENKWAAMHHTERAPSNFRINSSASYLAHLTETNDSDDTDETDQQQHHTFHMRKFNKNATSYNDDEDDDDEIERFDIDDELMKNDEISSERKLSEMKKTSFQLQFTSTFNEQSIWYQQDDMDDMKKSNCDDEDNDNDKIKSTPTLPDLFENHRMQQERASSNESNFEQLCSLRAHDTNNGSGLFPFQSSSTIRDEAVSKDDQFWKDHQIHLLNRNNNPHLNQSNTQCISSSSDDDIDGDDDDGLKIDSNIPDDEKYFVHTDIEIKEIIQPNNMMDIFRRQSPNSNKTNNMIKNSNGDNDLQTDLFTKCQQSNESHDIIVTHILSAGQPVEQQNCQTLTFIEHDEQENDDLNSNSDLLLQNNFSFLIAKGMLKPSPF